MKYVTTSAVAIATMLTSSQALAQDASDAVLPEAGLSDIIVTATKRSTSLQRTPIAVSSIGGEALAQKGARDVRALQDMVPALVLQEDRGATKASLRGVGSNLDIDSSDPAVAFNIDDVYTPREATGGALYDVARVEVLSGPQGTLYGRNAAGGAVNVFTNDPKSEFEGNAFLEAGTYAQVHASGAINVPLSDTLQVRVAADYHRRDGYMSNGLADLDSLAGRLKIRFAPSSSFSAVITAEHYRDDSLGNSPKFVVPSETFPSDIDPWAFDLDAKAAGFSSKIRYTKVHGSFEYKFGNGFVVNYIPAFVTYDSNVLNFTPPGKIRIHPKGDQYSQELRLSQTTGNLQWVSGLYWYRSDMPTEANLWLAPIPIDYPQTIQLFRTKTRSKAVFAQATYKLSDAFQLIGGLRYSSDERDGDGSNSFLPAAGVAFTTPFSVRLKSSKVDYKAGVQWDATSTNMAYFTVTSGYNQGGYVPTPDFTGTAYSFRPQTLVSYAVGSKNKFANNRLEINAEAYLYNLKDYQVSTFNLAAGGLIIVNAQSARMYGLDITSRFRPTESDTFSLSLGIGKAQARKFIVTAAQVGAENACDCSGLSLSNAPSFTASLGYLKTWSFNDGSSLEADLNSYISSGYWQTYNHAPQSYSPSFTRSNFSITYRAPDNNWNVGLWIKNIEDTDHYGAISQTYSLTTPTTGIIDPPRTAGIRAGYRF